MTGLLSKVKTIIEDTTLTVLYGLLALDGYTNWGSS